MGCTENWLLMKLPTYFSIFIAVSYYVFVIFYLHLRIDCASKLKYSKHLGTNSLLIKYMSKLDGFFLFSPMF